MFDPNAYMPRVNRNMAPRTVPTGTRKMAEDRRSLEFAIRTKRGNVELMLKGRQVTRASNVAIHATATV